MSGRHPKPKLVEGMRMRAATQVELGVFVFQCMDCGQHVTHFNPWREPLKRAVCSTPEYIRELVEHMTEVEKRELLQRG
jgi:hypothetical protein